MQLRRGLFRLYIVISALWVGWFGYVIYDANRKLSFTNKLITAYMERTGEYFPYDAKSVQQDDDLRESRRTAERALLALPLLAPIFYFICRWIVRGFRPDDKQHEKQVTEPEEQISAARVKPGSTLLLILTIIFSPVLWLIVPAAMSNFWVARGRKHDRD